MGTRREEAAGSNGRSCACNAGREHEQTGDLVTLCSLDEVRLIPSCSETVGPSPFPQVPDGVDLGASCVHNLVESSSE